MISKEMIGQLSGEIQEKISMQMETCKMQRMQKFATDGKIDSTQLMAFVLSEAKLFTTLYTTEFLLTIAEYDEMEEKAARGELNLEDDMEPGASDHPLEMKPDFELVKAGSEPPKDLQVEETSALEMLMEREVAQKGE